MILGVKEVLNKDSVDMNELFLSIDVRANGELRVADFVNFFEKNSVGLENMNEKLEIFIDKVNLREVGQAVSFKDFYMFFNI